MTLLDVSGLSTEFRTDEGVVQAVNDVDLTVKAGETVGIVGESGSGKSVTALSMLGLVDPPGYVTDGTVEFDGEDLRQASETRLEQIRGNDIGMVFQDPMESLNPVLTVGEQIAEAARVHGRFEGEEVDWLERSLLGNFVPRRSARKRHPRSWEYAVEMMRQVGIPEPEQRATEYPHQFSGGMQQRAMIAMALVCEPDLLIADEPTTALDVTIEAQILDRLAELQAERGMGVLLITHDLGVVVETCDRVAVMYAGQIVEQGSVEDVFSDPAHPYTRRLLDAIPDAKRGEGRLRAIEGNVPDLVDMPDACYFAPRCPHAHDACYEGVPGHESVGPDHVARCVLHREAGALPWEAEGAGDPAMADGGDGGRDTEGGDR
jgi:oligopeptide/dipeptide ABC transporter ATP-binding protein